MRLTRLTGLFTALLGGLAFTAGAADDKALGKSLFDGHCAGCHSATPAPRAMTPAEMAKLPPEKIFAALTSVD